MGKKFIIKIGIAVATILAIRVFSYAKDSKIKYTPEEQNVFELGKAQSEMGCEIYKNEKTIDKEAIEKKAEALSTIYGLEEKQVRENLEQNAKEEQALYLCAIRAGIDLNDDEYDSKIKEIQSGISQEEYEMFNAYLAGYGITEDEYWDIARDTYEREFIIDKYLKQYCIQNSYDDMIEQAECDIHIINGEYYINVGEQQYVDEKIQGEISKVIDDAVAEYNISIR